MRIIDILRESCRFIYVSTALLFLPKKRFAKTEKPPVFIIGCGHSGTSLVLAILAAHSNIYAVPYESAIFLSNNKRKATAKMTRFDMRACIAGKARWVEKTPRHINHIQRILEWCPTSKILLIIRDGRDVACSIKDRTGSLQQGIQRWITSNNEAMKYWNHPNIHCFHYEDLIADFEKTVKNILYFLGEQYEDGLAQYYKTPKRFYSFFLKKPKSCFGKYHDQYRNWQINQPLFDARGKYHSLTKKELDYLHDQAGDLLLKCGYHVP